MSWLMFIDESGHDHRNTPYEVRGGVALHAGKVWPLVEDLRLLELHAFGADLDQFRKEIKGATLLDKDRFRWARQDVRMEDEARRRHCRGFLTKGLEKKPPTRAEFTAYGQACVEWARGMFRLLTDHDAVLFAAAVPKGAPKPESHEAAEYLRKDHVFLQERFFYFLEGKREHGLLVMDETEKTADRRFVRLLGNYFRRTRTGGYRSQWIVPAPFFVASDMAYPVQVADVCIYCVNWGMRLPSAGMDAPCRREIADEFAPWLRRLEFHGQGYRDGTAFRSFGVVYVSDLYESRK